MSDPSVIQIFVFRQGTYVGSEIFAQPEIRIGRGDGIDLELDDPDVSRSHALLAHDRGEATLRDLGSISGCFVNQTRIAHAYITARDEIQIGAFTLKVKLLAQRAASAGGTARAPTPAAAPAPDSTSPWQNSPGDDSDDTRTEISNRAIRKATAQGAKPISQLTPALEVTGSDVVDTRLITDNPFAQSEAPLPRADTGPARTRRATPPPNEKLIRPASEPAAHHGPSNSQPHSQKLHDKQLHDQNLRDQNLEDRNLHDQNSDEEDLDEDEREARMVPGFSLIRNLARANDAGSHPTPARARALEIVSFSGEFVRSATLLKKKGDRYRLKKPNLKLAKLLGEGAAQIEFPSEADGAIVLPDRKIPLDELKIPGNAVSKRGDVYRTRIQADAVVTITIEGTGFLVRFVTPPVVASVETRFSFDRVIARALGSSVAAHVLVGILIGLTSSGVSYSEAARESWADPARDIREVEIKPEPPPPESIKEPEPEPEDIKPPEPPPATRPTPKQPKPPGAKRSTAAPKKGVPKQEIKTVGVLGAIGKVNLAAPGPKSMVQAVSNIDAVRAPGGSNFRVGALIGALPSSKVSVGGGGGGGLLTRGGAALLKGGEGLAEIGHRGGKVRGTVGRVSARTLQATGSISREEVARVINEHLSEVQYCYEKTLIKDPGLAGKLVMEWTINPNGSVGIVKQKLGTLRNPEVATCIISSLKRWTFPKPQGGVVIVSYPFIFNAVGF